MLNGNQPAYNCDFFVLRTPMLPYQAAIDLYARGNLLDQYTPEMVQEALYIASPVLYTAFLKYRDGQLQPREIKKVTTALWQYLVRMSTRCTPFGIFSGCSVGAFADNTRLQLPAPENIRRHMRLDMDYLCRVADELAGHSSIKTQLTYYPNSSLYRYARQWRYARYSYRGDTRIYDLVKVDMTPVLNKVIRQAATGLSFPQLVQTVMQFDVTEAEAAGYILQLIDAQLLTSDLEANVSGEEFTGELIRSLQRYQHTAPLVKVLSGAQQQMQHINTAPGVQAYRQIKESLSVLPVSIDESRLFQVDTVKHAVSSQLSATVAEDIKAALFLLARLNNEQPAQSRLEVFKRAFEERYGTETVPLATALDVENGIGFQQAYATADRYQQQRPAPAADIAHNPRTAFIFGKYREALATGAREIRISAGEAARFPLDPSMLPDAMDTVCSLYRGTEPGQHLIRFIGASPAAGKLLARFCHADETLARKVKALVRQEEALHPDKVYAEVLHLPQAKVGNILARPHLRKYEIPYLCRSTLPGRCQLPLQDLYLRMQEGRLLLLSKSLGKEVIPQLTAAHNFVHDSLPVYHFLSSLQFQGKYNNLAWDWGFLAQEPFLPRVCYNNVILKPATWNIPPAGLQSLTADALPRLQQELQLPDLVLLTEGDNELLLDLRTPMGLQLLTDAARQQPMVILQETLATPGNLLVESPAGAMTNEIIIPFVRQATAAPPLAAARKTGSSMWKPVTRRFPPGTEWAYYKIYAGENTTDSILRDILYPFARRMLRQKVIYEWFFIRYNDPHHHIRIRFHLTDKNNPVLWPAFTQALLPAFRQQLVSRIQMDTYERELERYGEGTIELSEAIFNINSTCIAELLPHFRQQQGKYRHLAGLLWIDCILSTLAYAPAAKVEFYRRNFEGFAAEFNIHQHKGQREWLQEDYRTHTAIIGQYLQSSGEDHAVAAIVKLFAPNAGAIIGHVRRYYEAEGLHYDYALRSYLHMFMNSLMPAQQRWEECRVYYSLLKYYTSQIARLSKKQVFSN